MVVGAGVELACQLARCAIGVFRLAAVNESARKRQYLTKLGRDDKAPARSVATPSSERWYDVPQRPHLRRTPQSSLSAI